MIVKALASRSPPPAAVCTPATAFAGCWRGVLDGLLGVFAGCVVPFDAEAAGHYARLAVRAHKAGRGLPAPNGYIAGIAAAHGFPVASRDTVPFKAAGLAVIDPWQPAAG